MHTKKSNNQLYLMKSTLKRDKLNGFFFPSPHWKKGQTTGFEMADKSPRKLMYCYCTMLTFCVIVGD